MVQVVGALARCPPAPVALSIAVVIFQCSPGAQPARGERSSVWMSCRNGGFFES
jgi:hypothetical protein